MGQEIPTAGKNNAGLIGQIIWRVSSSFNLWETSVYGQCSFAGFVFSQGFSLFSDMTYAYKQICPWAYWTWSWHWAGRQGMEYPLDCDTGLGFSEFSLLRDRHEDELWPVMSGEHQWRQCWGNTRWKKERDEHDPSPSACIAPMSAPWLFSFAIYDS